MSLASIALRREGLPLTTCNLHFSFHEPCNTDPLRDTGALVRYWGVVAQLDGRVLRVVAMEDGETILNAFPDRNFKVKIDTV